MAENAGVESKTSSTTRSAKNSLSNLAENTEVGDNGNSGDNETVKISSFSNKPNIPIGYFTSLHSKKRSIFHNSFGYSWGFQLEALPK